MDIKLLTIGKPKHAFAQDGIDLYLNKISRIIPCSILYLKESKFKNETKYATEIVEEEGTRFLDQMTSGIYSILFDRKGQPLSSIGFSNFINVALGKHYSSILFIVGGFIGISEKVKRRANAIVSLSNMTLSREVALVVSAEQIFRALTIIKGFPYHK